MGAWDIGNFDNDTALDFIGMLAENETLTPVENAFDAVLAEQDYLDADRGCEALAAGEVIALLRGKPGAFVPESLASWHAANPNLVVSTDLHAAAIEAVRRVMGGGIVPSELYELWEEADELDAWIAVVDDLLERVRK